MGEGAVVQNSSWSFSSQTPDPMTQVISGPKKLVRPMGHWVQRGSDCLFLSKPCVPITGPMDIPRTISLAISVEIMKLKLKCQKHEGCCRDTLGTVRNAVGTVGTVGTNILELLGVTPNMRSLRSLQSLQCFARSLGGPYKNVYVSQTVSFALPCRCSTPCERHVKAHIKLNMRKTCKPTMFGLGQLAV